MPEKLNRKPLDSIIPAGMEIKLPEWKIKAPDLKPIAAQMQLQMKAIHESVRDDIYGWADDTSSFMSENLMGTEQFVTDYT